jgi:hypothetical protein
MKIMAGKTLVLFFSSGASNFDVFRLWTFQLIFAGTDDT